MQDLWHPVCELQLDKGFMVRLVLDDGQGRWEASTEPQADGSHVLRDQTV